MSTPCLNVAAVAPRTHAEGPGCRYAIWLQGCLRRCRGCCNPHLFDLVPRRLVDAEVLAAEILAGAAELEGVTLLGGEPLLQAAGAAMLAKRCREAGLGVIVFTGYSLSELRDAGLEGVTDLLAWTDLLVDGAYEADQPETRRNWVGSTNQRFHYLTTRYTPAIELEPHAEQRVEITIGPDGAVMQNGWPTLARTRP